MTCHTRATTATSAAIEERKAKQLSRRQDNVTRTDGHPKPQLNAITMVRGHSNLLPNEAYTVISRSSENKPLISAVTNSSISVIMSLAPLPTE